MRWLIAIPVHNEETHVERVLGQVRSYHDDILVVDDGSTDATSQILHRLAARRRLRWIRHAVNRGYGQSIIDAFAFAAAHEYDWVITMDCDEQHESRSIPRFVQLMELDAWDIISGSRYLLPQPDDDLPPNDRRSINAIITARVNRQLGLNITDAFCGFKAHRVMPTHALGLDEPGYAFPLQLWPRAAKAGLRITEIPVRLIYNDPGRHFGGSLDDPGCRLSHYRQVLAAEIQRPAPVPQTSEHVCDLADCCCPD